MVYTMLSSSCPEKSVTQKRGFDQEITYLSPEKQNYPHGDQESFHTVKQNPFTEKSG